MAGISSTIRVNDNVSNVLVGMNRAIHAVISSMERMENVTGQSVNTTEIAAAKQELSGTALAIREIEEDIQRQIAAEEEAREAARKTREEKERTRTAERAAREETERTARAHDDLLGKVKNIAVAYAAMQAAAKTVELSDQMTQTDSRLNLIVDADTGNAKDSVEELKQKIMESANRSRSSYMDTASSVTAFAQRAGDAFKNNDEVLSFAETLNKMYVIAGASQEEQASSMLQLTQALGSGVLRGEEFNAVFEAAPNIIQSIAEYMEMDIGKMRELAKEGEISAEVVKNAVLANAGEVNSQFDSMAMTWQQVTTLAKNQAIQAFQPVLQKVSELANNQSVQTFAMNAANSLATVAELVLFFVEMASNGAGFIAENWDMLSPVIYGVAGALAIYYGALLLVNAAEGIGAGLHVAMAGAQMLKLAATGSLTTATIAETAAQNGLNAAMWASPITWIIGAIIALVIALYAGVAGFNSLTDSSVSATGIITGAFGYLAALVVNSFIQIWNEAANLVNFLANVLGGNVPEAIQVAFLDMEYDVLSVISNIASTIQDLLNKIPGVEVDFADDLEGFKDYIGDKSTEVKNETEWKEVMARKEYVDVTEWASAGYEVGAFAESKVTDTVENLFKGPEVKDLASDLANSMPTIPDYKDIAGNTKKTADNTDKVAKSLEISDEDIKYLRDIAEKEAVNKFTTAKISVDMKNNNTVNSDYDLDGMVSKLEQKLYEEMSRAAEGVY